MGEWSKAPDYELRSRVAESNPYHASNFSPQISKKSTRYTQSVMQELKNILSSIHCQSLYCKWAQQEYRVSYFYKEVETPLQMSASYISSLNFDARKKIISALDKVISCQELYAPDYLIFV